MPSCQPWHCKLDQKCGQGPQDRIWQQEDAADFLWKMELSRSIQVHLHLPLQPGVLLLMAAGSLSLKTVILSWLPVRLSIFASSPLLSSNSASFLSTWSCPHLNCPCVSANLEPHRKCHREALMVLCSFWVTGLCQSWPCPLTAAEGWFPPFPCLKD